MKERSTPELAAAAIFAQLDFLPVSDERRYYQNSSLAANLHCSSIQGSPWQQFLRVSVKGRQTEDVPRASSFETASLNPPRPRELQPE